VEASHEAIAFELWLREWSADFTATERFRRLPSARDTHAAMSKTSSMLTTLRLYLASTENPTETRNKCMRYTQPQILNSTGQQSPSNIGKSSKRWVPYDHTTDMYAFSDNLHTRLTSRLSCTQSPLSNALDLRLSWPSRSKASSWGFVRPRTVPGSAPEIRTQSRSCCLTRHIRGRAGGTGRHCADALTAHDRHYVFAPEELAQRPLLV